MKFRVVLKAYNSNLLSLTCQQMQAILLSKGCEIIGVVSLPIQRKRFCVLRSPHVDKDSREHFEVRLSKRFIDISTDSPKILNFLFRAELPSGVLCSLKILNSASI